jgi:hypothetical protein
MNIMVVPKKEDLDISNSNLGEDFDFFLEHREEFLAFMEMETDVIDFAFRVQKLVSEDMDVGANNFFERFVGHKTSGFALICSMANVMHQNVKTKNEGAVKKLISDLALLLFLAESRIEDRGVFKDDIINLKEASKIVDEPEVNRISLVDEDLNKAEEVSDPRPNITGLDPKTDVFQIVTENSRRITVEPTTLNYYFVKRPEKVKNLLGNCWLSRNDRVEEVIGKTVMLIRYNNNGIVPFGEYVVDKVNGCLCLIKCLPEDEEEENDDESMANLILKCKNPLDFLEYPTVTLERSMFTEKYGEVKKELVVTVSNEHNGVKHIWGRWQLVPEESNETTLFFIPVKKTRKRLVHSVLKSFPNLNTNLAHMRFDKYLASLHKTTKSSISKTKTTVTAPKSTLPSHIPSTETCTETMDVMYYNWAKKTWDTVTLTRVSCRITEDNVLFFMSDTHIGDWKKVKALGNRVVTVKLKLNNSDISGIGYSSRKLLRRLYNEGDKAGTEYSMTFRTAVFDEGLVMVPHNVEEDGSVLNPTYYSFDTLQIDVDNETSYFPNDDFMIHELSDTKGNYFFGFCADNMQNWDKRYDHEDFRDDMENADEVVMYLDGSAGERFDDIHVIGDYVFLIKGDIESETYKEALVYMAMYEKLYYIFKNTSPYRKGKLGLDTTISLSDLRRKVAYGKTEKKLKKPPRRKESQITF